MKFKVEWEATTDQGEHISGIENEASWFLIDQQGKMWSYGPMEAPKQIKYGTGNYSYSKCRPLFEIGNEWLSFEEIKKRLLIQELNQNYLKGDSK